MNQHSTIELFSTEWFIKTILSIATICLVLMIGLRLSENGKKYLRISLGISCLLAAILIHPYLVSIGGWSLQNSLPLHLCTLTEIVAGVVLIWPRQRSFELLGYWGIPGGIHSILTPELLHTGEDGWLMFEYYFLHTNLVLAPLFLMVVLNMRLTDKSWLRIFFVTQLCLPVIGLINWTLGSNYMYLAEKPIADNPLVIGKWPWYILVFDLAMLVHFYLVFIISTKWMKISHIFYKPKNIKV